MSTGTFGIRALKLEKAELIEMVLLRSFFGVGSGGGEHSDEVL